MTSPRRSAIMVSASRITVSVVRPRKSIFNMPAFSRQFMSYWLTTTCSSSALEPEPLDVCVHTGTYSCTGPGAMTTPAAWTPVWRLSPSSAIA